MARLSVRIIGNVVDRRGEHHGVLVEKDGVLIHAVDCATPEDAQETAELLRQGISIGLTANQRKPSLYKVRKTKTGWVVQVNPDTIRRRSAR